MHSKNLFAKGKDQSQKTFLSACPSSYWCRWHHPRENPKVGHEICTEAVETDSPPFSQGVIWVCTKPVPDPCITSREWYHEQGILVSLCSTSALGTGKRRSWSPDGVSWCNQLGVGLVNAGSDTQSLFSFFSFFFLFTVKLFEIF